MAELGLQHAETADAVFTDDVERGPGPESQAWRARADAEHARLRWLAGVHAPDEDALVASWEHAVAAFERLGHVFELARSRARLGSVLRAAGRQAEAAERTEWAVDTARRLGAAPLLAELGSVPLRTPRRPRETSMEVLTDRELEVLVLVAAGRSNRDIGRQLFISPKTASVHVSHILAKLGAGGRTEAVALARTRGLLPDDPT